MIEIVNLSKTFNAGTINEVVALSNINLSIRQGSFVVVLGTNGSGKSTLLSAIAGSFLPDSGSIHLEDMEMTRMPEHKRARYIGRVFQNPYSGTAPDMSIAENLSLAARRGKRRGLANALPASLTEAFRQRIRALNMGLEDRLDSEIGKLSGGQRQALTLLMASWCKPRLLLLDEHTAALDPRTASKVIQLTEEVVSKDSLTTLMVTHSMSQATRMGDRILLMHRGRIVHDIDGVEKKNLRPADLLVLFDDIRKKDQIDQSVADMVAKEYI